MKDSVTNEHTIFIAGNFACYPEPAAIEAAQYFANTPAKMIHKYPPIPHPIPIILLFALQYHSMYCFQLETDRRPLDYHRFLLPHKQGGRYLQRGRHAKDNGLAIVSLGQSEPDLLL